MSADHSDPGQGTDGSSREDRLLDAVADFVRLHEASDPLAEDIDQFLGRYPKELRGELRTLCAAHLAVAREFPSPGLDSSVAARARGRPAGLSRRIGDFTILEELGHGGMGVVYLAEQAGLGRRVALKVLKPGLSFSKTHKERFRREAAAAGKLQHPGIVPIHSYGEADGILYYAMEFLPGRDLAQTIVSMADSPPAQRRLGLLPGAPYPMEVAELVARIAEATHYAHGEGIIHRDIKPSNVLIGADGSLRLLDFGLAKNLDDGDLALTRSGDLTGTPFYMSPEQTLARRAPVDHRTDVYSLGVILYELCTLRRPFQGEDLQQLVFQICFGEPEPIQRSHPEIPRDLSVISARAMEKDPRKRYDSAGELAADLRRFMELRPIHARPVSWLARGARMLRRHRLLASAAGALVLAACVAGGLNLNQVMANRSRVEDNLRSAEDLRKAGEFQGALALLRDAAVTEPESERIRARVRSVEVAIEQRRREKELARLRAERLLTQSAMELDRDPSLALALAVEGTARVAERDASPGDQAATLAALTAIFPAKVLGTAEGAWPAALVLAPSAGYAATVGRSGARLWELDSSPEPVATVIPTRSKRTSALAISGDGRTIAVAEAGERVSLWTYPERAPKAEIQLSGARAHDLALSTDGGFLAVRTADLRLVVYRVGDAAAAPLFERRLPRPPQTLAFSPAEPLLLVGYDGVLARILRSDGSLAFEWEGMRGPAARLRPAVQWARGGRALVRTAGMRALEVRDLDRDPAKTGLRIEYAATTASMRVSPGGNLIAAGLDDHTARVWSLETGKELRVFASHRGVVHHVALDEAGGTLATAGLDGTVAVHDLKTGRTLARLPLQGSVAQIELTGSGEVLVCRFLDAAPQAWKLSAARPAYALTAHRARVRSLDFSPDGEILVSTAEDGELAVWSGANGRQRGTTRVRGMGGADRWVLFPGESDRIRVIASEHVTDLRLEDLERLGHLQIRQDGSRPEPGQRHIARRGVHHASLDPVSGSQLLVLGSGVQRLHTGEEGELELESLVEAGNDRLLAAQALGVEGAAYLRAGSGLEIQTPEGPLLANGSAGLGPLLVRSAQGDRLAVGGRGGCRVYSGRGEQLLALPEDGSGLSSLAISAAGDRLAVGRRDGSVEWWDVDGERRLLAWRPHAGAVNAIAISPDGRRIASGSESGDVRVWPVDPMAAALDFGVRRLTMLERERLGLLRPGDQAMRAAVDALYRKHVLTREVLSALETQGDVPLEEARIYALERRNPPSHELEQQAAQALLDPERPESGVQVALGQALAASRLAGRDANPKILAALGMHRLGQHREALEMLERAMALEPSLREDLGWAVQALCYSALDRKPDARAALRRLGDGRNRLRGTQGPGPGPRPQGPRSPAGTGHWIEVARAAVLAD